MAIIFLSSIGLAQNQKNYFGISYDQYLAASASNLTNSPAFTIHLATVNDNFELRFSFSYPVFLISADALVNLQIEKDFRVYAGAGLGIIPIVSVFEMHTVLGAELKLEGFGIFTEWQVFSFLTNKSPSGSKIRLGFNIPF